VQGNVSFLGVGEFILLFNGMIQTWVTITLMYNRFQMKDMVSRVFFVALFTATVTAAVHLDDALGDHGPGHYTALACIFFVLAVMKLYIGSWIRRVERLSTFEASMQFCFGLYHLLIGWLPYLLLDDKTDRKTMRAIMVGANHIFVVFGSMPVHRMFLRSAEYDENGKMVRPPDHVPWHHLKIRCIS